MSRERFSMCAKSTLADAALQAAGFEDASKYLDCMYDL